MNLKILSGPEVSRFLECLEEANDNEMEAMDIFRSTKRVSPNARPLVVLYERRPFRMTEYVSLDDAKDDLKVSAKTVRQSELGADSMQFHLVLY